MDTHAVFSNGHGSLTIALAGNPNAGKTTLFNSLTGLNQKVANYPGVTVERKAGIVAARRKPAELIDLPGPLQPRRHVARRADRTRRAYRRASRGIPSPDAGVAVVDATNLERNLYLVTQLFEYGVPVVVALTMIDVFEKQKHKIDIRKAFEGC